MTTPAATCSTQISNQANGIHQSTATNLGNDWDSLVTTVIGGQNPTGGQNFTRGQNPTRGQTLNLEKGRDTGTGRRAGVRQENTLELSEGKWAEKPKYEEIDSQMLVTEGGEEEEQEDEKERKGTDREEAGWLSKVEPGVRLRLKEQLTEVL